MCKNAHFLQVCTVGGCIDGMNTKKLIQSAAFELFERKQFDSITVQEIADSAGISRRCFYNHYNDKYELMHIYFTEHLMEFMNPGSDAPVIVQYEAFYDFVREHKAFFLNMSDPSRPDSFWDFLDNFLVSYYCEIWCAANETVDIPEREKYKLYATAAAGVSLMKSCLSKTNTLSSKEFAELSAELIPPITVKDNSRP